MNGEKIWEEAVRAAERIVHPDPVDSARGLDVLMKTTIKRAILLERKRASQVARIMGHPLIEAAIMDGMDKEFWDE